MTSRELSTDERALMTKMLGRLGSSFDTERAVAGKMLSDFLQARQLSWADVFGAPASNFSAEQQAFQRGRAAGAAEEQLRTAAATASVEGAAFTRGRAAGIAEERQRAATATAAADFIRSHASRGTAAQQQTNAPPAGSGWHATVAACLSKAAWLKPKDRNFLESLQRRGAYYQLTTPQIDWLSDICRGANVPFAQAA
jgi:hypothetical protein